MYLFEDRFTCKFKSWQDKKDDRVQIFFSLHLQHYIRRLLLEMVTICSAPGNPLPCRGATDVSEHSASAKKESTFQRALLLCKSDGRTSKANDSLVLDDHL